MKKVLVLFIAIISLLTISSCKNNTEIDYNEDRTALSSEVATSWFGVESDYREDYLNKPEEVDLTKERVEVHAPKDMKKMARYTISNIEDALAGGKVKNVFVSYWSMSNLFQAGTSSYTVNPIVDNFDNDIKNVFTDLEAIKFESWNNPIPSAEISDFDKVDGKNRTLEVLYVPYLVKHFYPREDSNAQCILTTFIIAPIYYELNVLAGDNKLPEASKLNMYSKIDLAFDGTLISPNLKKTA